MLQQKIIRAPNHKDASVLGENISLAHAHLLVQSSLTILVVTRFIGTKPSIGLFITSSALHLLQGKSEVQNTNLGLNICLNILFSIRLIIFIITIKVVTVILKFILRCIYQDMTFTMI